MENKINVTYYNPQQLNEDCLRHIFKELNLREQFILYKISNYFKCIILSIWRIKFSKCLNLDEECYLKILNNTDALEVVTIILNLTTKVHNLNAKLYKALTTTNQNIFRNITSLSIKSPATKCEQFDISFNPEMFIALRFMHLQRMTLSIKGLTTLKQLKVLKLIHCKANGTNNLSELFKDLQLTTFTLIAPKKSAENRCQDIPTFQLDSINCCTTLETLKVSAMDLTTGIVKEICQLPLLKKLTIFTHHYVNLKCEMYALRKIVEVVRTLKAVMVRLIRLKCYFEWSLLEQMLHLENLHTFCWHAQFEVCNEADGIEWAAYNPNILRKAVIRFAELHRHRLKILNFSRNCHASKSFIESVIKKTNLMVIHDDLNDANVISKPTKPEDDWSQFDCLEFEM